LEQKQRYLYGVITVSKKPALSLTLSSQTGQIHKRRQVAFVNMGERKRSIRRFQSWKTLPEWSGLQ
jgi:hypothetical protein